MGRVPRNEGGRDGAMRPRAREPEDWWPPEAGSGEAGVCPEPQREHRPGDTLVLNLQPPDPE